MAIGGLQPCAQEGDEGIKIKGHMFPIFSSAHTKPPASDASPEAPSPLDLAPFQHFNCAAVLPLEVEWHADSEASSDSSELADGAASPMNPPPTPAALVEFTMTVLNESAPPRKRARSAATPGRTSSAGSIAPTSPEELSSTPSEGGDQHGAQRGPRGTNVRSNPQMQKTARDGQKHWHEKVQHMRDQYDAANTEMAHKQFSEQRLVCMVRALKCQKESLLIYLQMATQQGLISPLPFVHPADETAGFLGWTGFYVQTGCGQRFRAGVEGLFPETPKRNTLYHLFRRSGLVPEDWLRAWSGEVPFSWNVGRAASC
jgi:hypothetical protein